MNKKVFSLFALLCCLAMPLVAFGATTPSPNTWIVTQRDMIIDFIWYPFLAIVILTFMWAGYSFLTAQGDPSKIEDARKAVLWGVIGIIIALLAYSIVAIISGALGLGTGIPTGACCTSGFCSEVPQQTCDDAGGDFSDFLHCSTPGFSCAPAGGGAACISAGEICINAAGVRVGTCCNSAACISNAGDGVYRCSAGAATGACCWGQTCSVVPRASCSGVNRIWDGSPTCQGIVCNVGAG